MMVEMNLPYILDAALVQDEYLCVPSVVSTEPSTIPTDPFNRICPFLNFLNKGVREQAAMVGSHLEERPYSFWMGTLRVQDE